MAATKGCNFNMTGKAFRTPRFLWMNTCKMDVDGLSCHVLARTWFRQDFKGRGRSHRTFAHEPAFNACRDRNESTRTWEAGSIADQLSYCARLWKSARLLPPHPAVESNHVFLLAGAIIFVWMMLVLQVFTKVQQRSNLGLGAKNSKPSYEKNARRCITPLRYILLS